MSEFPGLQQVAEVRKRVVQLQTGEITEQPRYLMTSLRPEQAGPADLLALFRGHWGIENRLFWVKDDSFGEDRHVLQRHTRGEVVGLLRSTACNLLRGRCACWPETAPLTARAEWVASHPATILPRLCKDPRQPAWEVSEASRCGKMGGFPDVITVLCPPLISAFRPVIVSPGTR